MPDMPGQQLADTDGKASPAAAGLAAEALSPTVNIITTAKPAMSDDSLMAFAKAQGLDEAAMAMIFQNKPVPVQQVPATDPNPAELAIEPTGTSDQKTVAKPAQPGQVLTGMLALGANASMRWSIGKPDQAPQEPASTPELAAASSALKPVMFGLNGASKTVTATTNTQPTTDAEGTEEPKNLAASLTLGAGAAETMQMAKRQQTKFVDQRADNNEKLSANLIAKAAMSEVSMSTSSSALPAETLILGEDLSSQDLQSILTQRTDAGTQGSLAINQPADIVGPAGTGTDMAVRSEQYEKLSQRLGEALGQRLSAQIARGDWKVELELKPHDMGSIDIQLSMNKGELEASFKASNASTRGLIADSLPRLKEVLAQSGMEVAGLNVNVGQNSQNGGNPTPGQQQKSGAVVSTAQGDGAKSTMAMGPATIRKAAGPDGLDVLV
jgi:flagellar hook-length control protein FliK